MRKTFVGGAGVVGDDGPRRLSIEELAARWGYSVSGIRKLIAKGQIPPSAFFKLGGRGSRLIFRAEEIERVERERT